MTENNDTSTNATLPVERRTYLQGLTAGVALTGAVAGAGAAVESETLASEAVEPEDNDNLAGTSVGYGYPLEDESEYEEGDPVGYGYGTYGDTRPPSVTGDPDDLPTEAEGFEDGLFEDITGDGEFDIADVQFFFDNLDNTAVSAYAPFYNFSGINEASVSIFDVQAQFNRLQDN